VQLLKERLKETLKIIGEALNRIRNTDSEVLQRISEHRRVIGFRNILIHGYDVADESIVWEAVRKHLPILVREINGIMGGDK